MHFVLTQFAVSDKQWWLLASLADDVEKQNQNFWFSQNHGSGTLC